MKRHNRSKHGLLCLMLCILMVFTQLPIAALAAEYPYRYPTEKPYYEMSMYAYKVNAADAESYPTAIFRLLTDDNRTRYAYCADSEIYDIPGTAYKAVSLSDHYGGETEDAGKLRAIIRNSYPFIGMNEMISRMKRSGIALHTASVPCYEMVLISAVQQAIFSHTNPDIVIELRFAGGFPKMGYEMYKPFIYHYNNNYKDNKVIQAYPDIKADVEAVYSWLCALSPTNAPAAPSVNVSFAAKTEQAAGGYTLTLYDLFDGFESYRESMNVTVTAAAGTNETVILTKPFNELSAIGEGRYTTALPETVAGNSLKVTLNGWYEYEDAVIYEAEEAGPEMSQPFIGYGKARAPFSKTEQIDLPMQTGSLIVRKTVSDEDPDADKGFTFTVTLMQNGAPPNGDIVCGDVTFTNGTASFVLKHDESKTIEGIPAGFAYHVEESDNGGYAVKVNDTDAATASGIIAAGQTATAAFDNSWQGGGYAFPDPAVVKLTAAKTLDGIAPAGSSFAFVLKDENGQIVQTGYNDGEQILFEAMSFTNTGTYKYTIEEVAGNDRSINYDGSVYTVIIKVTESDSYHAEIAYEKNGAAYQGNPVFANTTKSSPPMIILYNDIVSVSARKVWRDGGADDRPNEVSVRLYRNGNAYGDAVTLSESNSWYYTWSDLDGDYTWTVDEVNIPRGYARSITQNGNEWTITNTKRTENNPETGDNAGMAGWIALTCISAAGMWAAVCGRRRISRRRR